MQTKLVKRSALALAGIYLLLPVMAGAFGWSDRDGPKIYPTTLHQLGFYVGMKIRGRSAFYSFYGKQRPWFYFMKLEDAPWLERVRDAERQRLEAISAGEK